MITNMSKGLHAPDFSGFGIMVVSDILSYCVVIKIKFQFSWKCGVETPPEVIA